MASPAGGSAGHCWSTPKRGSRATAGPPADASRSTPPTSTWTARALLSPPRGPGASRQTRPASVSPLAAGYRLEQVERFSRSGLPARLRHLDALEREAPAARGAVRDRGAGRPCPEEYVAQLAVLMSRMSTDAPSGALSYEAETGTSPGSATSRTLAAGRPSPPWWRRPGTGRTRRTGGLHGPPDRTGKPWLARPGRHPGRPATAGTGWACWSRSATCGGCGRLPGRGTRPDLQRRRKRPHARHQRRAGIQARRLRRRVAADRGRRHSRRASRGTPAQTGICWR